MMSFGILMIFAAGTAFTPAGLAGLPAQRTAARHASARAGVFDFLAFGKAGASHILVSDNARAQRIKAQIEAGQVNFADAAREFSTCPSGAKGGDLGTFGPGQMVGAFNDYCFDPDTVVGELGLVKTKFGSHVIKLTKKP